MSNSLNPTEFWWPSLSAFDDLTIEFEEKEDGGLLMHLNAPEGSECSEWLSYFQETPERQELFEQELIKSLLQHSLRLTHGESERLPDEQGGDHPGGQEDRTGSVEEH
jgi:hypothetical protein